MRHDVEEHFRSLTPFEFEVDFGDGFGSDTVPDHTDIDWLFNSLDPEERTRYDQLDEEFWGPVGLTRPPPG